MRSRWLPTAPHPPVESVPPVESLLSSLGPVESAMVWTDADGLDGQEGGGPVESAPVSAALPASVRLCGGRARSRNHAPAAWLADGARRSSPSLSTTGPGTAGRRRGGPESQGLLQLPASLPPSLRPSPPPSVPPFLPASLPPSLMMIHCASVRPNHSGCTAWLCRRGQRHPGAVWAAELRLEPGATVSSGHRPREGGRICRTWAEERELLRDEPKERAWTSLEHGSCQQVRVIGGGGRLVGV